jgi:hypothetical protein
MTAQSLIERPPHRLGLFRARRRPAHRLGDDAMSGAAAMVVVLDCASYRRRAGLGAGAAQGAPASPLLAIVLAVLVVIGALLLFFMMRGG